jgi:hypothetical protein
MKTFAMIEPLTVTALASLVTGCMSLNANPNYTSSGALIPMRFGCVPADTEACLAGIVSGILVARKSRLAWIASEPAAFRR